MATVSTEFFDRPPITFVERLFTAADLAAMPEELPSGLVKYELDNGRLVTMAPPSEPHSNSQALITAILVTQGELRGHGKAYSEVGVVLWKTPIRVVGPDAAFVKHSSLPVKTSSEGYLETIPELVVEVRSKNDSKPYVARKVADYLAAGVQLVWVIDPEEKSVVEHRPNAAAQTFTSADVLICDDIIPDFELPVSNLFRS
jgi:Uma2 family endonuclease